MNPKVTTKPLLIDPNQFTAYELCVGPNVLGPRKCMKCNHPFKPGEIWQRMKSLPDPEYGSYFIGVHSHCLSRETESDGTRRAAKPMPCS